MSKPTVARAKVVPLHPEFEPLTLADIVVTWQESPLADPKTATGAQIARLLTRESEEVPSGVFATRHDAGIAVPLLRGMADLVFPDPRSLDHLDPDTRFFISESLGHIAARVAAEEIDHPDRPRKFTIRVERGAGLRNHDSDPKTPEVSR